jgi:MFS family permease
MVMRPHLTLFLGIFSVMALSNAIVPVLPSYSTGSSMQGIIFSVYFLGAFLVTLPAGILSDRYGRIPAVRLGLALTVTSGLFLAVASDTVPVILARFIEGTGAGIFVAAAMSWVNSESDHVRQSGWLMASLNAGLVLGLLLTGWLAAFLHDPASGILFFALVAAVPAICSFFVREPLSYEPIIRTAEYRYGSVIYFISRYRWLWLSSIVLIGITGVITSLYPKFSGASSDVLGLWIAGMSIATIAAVLIYSRTSLEPVPVIRWSAILIGAGVLISYWSAAGFLVLGALAGVVMIAQMAFLSGIREHQGIVMGLFSTTSYLGMAILPAAAGFIAEYFSFSLAFCVTAFSAVVVAFTIGRCFCNIDGGHRQDWAVTGKEQ